MSTDASFTHPNENEFENSWSQMPLVPSRPPLNSIPDPSQYQAETPQRQPQHDLPDSSRDYRRKKPEGSAETQLVSAVLRTPKVYGRGKWTNSEPNSAQTTPIRSGHRVSIGVGNAGARGCGLPRASRRFSIATPQQLLTDAPQFELEDDPSFWNDHNVQVLIRIRPLNSSEMISQGYGRCLRQESAQTVVWLGHPETRFTFDHIAGESISQEKLFVAAGLPMVDNCMSGYNSCMFAYGQTGSGKTYTMMGEIDKMDGKFNEDCGITPRIFEYLFSRITKEEERRAYERLTYSCKCSFLEIYNEQITDLLEPSSTNLQLREDSKKGVYVENLTEHSVRTVNDVLQLLQQGAANRKIAATHMNCESSRSHSVFTCIIESRWEKDSMAHLRFGRLNLVDLAGSERQKSSGAEGDRLKEAANINKSLSTLGLVIMSLVDLAQGKHRHVPYRDSRLTFLLQDSLGGNSKTTIIANVSPSICAANETLSTLKFAQRAKLIQNNAKVNEDASAGVIALQQQIQHLKDQLSFLMKHQHDSVELMDIVPRQEQSSLGVFSDGYEATNETKRHDRDEARKGGLMKKKYFKATFHDDLRRDKLAETEIKRLKAEIERLNHLAHQQKEEAQRLTMMLNFREEKVKRLEFLMNGLVSSNKLSLDENSAVREEILLLQAKIERSPEEIQNATKNNRFQDFCVQGERETLLAEISEPRNQLLESLEVQKIQARHQLSPMKIYQEPEVSKELEKCREMNSKLLREVDELQRQLSNRRESSEDTFNSIHNVSRRSDLIEEAASSNFPGDEVTDVSNDDKMGYLPIVHCDNIDKQLVDAQSLIETMNLEQLKLIRELESVKTENQHLMKRLERNQYSTVSIDGSKGTSILTLQNKLEKLSKDLKEAQILNVKHIEDYAAQLSQDQQTEVVRSEVEMETTRTIIHLQEEIDRLQSEFHGCLRFMAEENLSLRNSVSAKEDELRMLCKEWERATFELTTFLIDGSRSLGNASHEIKSIASSFPNVNDWINEHVERAAKMCVEKEETILLLQNSLEDAQNTMIQMEDKLYSLRGATIALTEFQQLERSSSREEIQLPRMPHDLTEEKEFPVHNSMSKKGHVTDSQANTSIPVELTISDRSTSTPGGICDEDRPLVCASSLATRDVDIQVELASFIAERENAVNGTCADAETYLSALNSQIRDTVSLSKGLVRDVTNNGNDIRKDIEGLKRDQGSLRFLSNTIPSDLPLRHENQLLILQQVRNELVEIKDRLNSMSACFYKVMNMHCNQDSMEVTTEMDGWTSDCFSSCSSASVESFDNDDKTSCNRCKCMDRITEQTLDLNSNEESNLTRNRAILLLRKEWRKMYEAFIKLKNHLMVFSTGEANQKCSAGLLPISDLHAVEKLNKEGNELGEPISKAQAYINNFGELAVEEKHNPPSSFLAKCEEAYASMKEADYMLKAMLKANEYANTLTAMWKQAGEELMLDNASLSEEIKQLKSCVLLMNGEKEVLQNAIQSALSVKGDILSSLEECFCAMQTVPEDLFETSCNDATNVVEEMNACFGSLRSSLEDLMRKAIQNDISIFVLQCQMREYSHEFSRLNTISNSDQSILQEHPIVTDNLEPSPDHYSALEPLRCEGKGCQVACVSRNENTEFELVNCDDVDKSSELQRELEWKDVLLKGLLFDFSLLQEFASHRKDIKDELEKLIVAMSKVQQELQIKNVQLDDTLVEKTRLEGLLSETEQSLFSSNSELNQAKEALNILSEQNVALKDILRDLYLKNSEAEQLLEDRNEAIKSFEREIIRISSSQEKHLVPSLEDYEDALTQVTAERDQLREKLTSLEDKLDMVSAVADENQAIAAKARQESETCKTYAEQKEEEVKILERSVEELESTINVLEKKVLEMEEDVEQQRLIRDSLELELQALRERLLTVEDLTESMASENSSAGVLEDQLARKLYSRSQKINEAHSRIRFLEEENAKQAKEIRQFRDYISELVLHAEAQASQYQQKYKTLEAMLNEVQTDVTHVSAASTSERADKLSARPRGSSSPFRCIAGLVQQMNQEKDQELSSARIRIEELEALAACRHKEVCVLNTKLATAESMTHDVIRDLLSVKLDISNYANIIEQHQLQKLIEEAQHRRQDFVAMEHEVVSLRSQIDDLLEERERCYAEINRNKADQLAIQITLEQLQEQDQFLIAQNDMLKMDKCNLQKRVAELDDMVKKLFSMQDSRTPRIQPQRTRPFEIELGERLAHSQKMLSRVNSQLAQYRRPDSTRLDGNETTSRGSRSRNQNHL